MATLSYWIDDLERATIPIGFVGENNYRQIIINCKKVFDKYPSLIPTLTVTPPKGDPYPAVVTRDEDNVCWDIQNSDLVYRGNGELQLSFVEYEDGEPVEDGIVGKTYVAKTRIERSILPVGEAPDPITNWLVQANAALGAIPQTILDALAAAKASGEFDGEDGVGIQRIEKTSTSGLVDTYTVILTDESTYVYTVTNGKEGEPGKPGDPGATGVGIRSIEKTGTSGLVDTYTITYTDGRTSTFTVTNGAKGEPGTPGQDGISPTVTVEDITGGHRVTITDKNGSRTFDVMNGAKGDKGDPGDPSELIDDTNPSATTKTFSAYKVSEMNSSLLNALNQSVDSTRKSIRTNLLESYLYKENCYFDSSFVETALEGYDIFKFPTDYIHFLYLTWVGNSLPRGTLTYDHVFVYEDNLGNFSGGITGETGAVNESRKYNLVIFPNGCKYFYLTLKHDVLSNVTISIDYPYDSFARTNYKRNSSVTCNEYNAVKNINYFNNNGINELGVNAYWIYVRKDDVVKFKEKTFSGLSWIAQTIVYATRERTNWNNVSEITIDADSILIVLAPESNPENAVLYPAERETSIENRVDALELTAGNIDSIETDVDNLRAFVEGTSDVTYTSGDQSGYYSLVNGVITHKTSSSFTCRKFEVAQWMYKVSYEIKSITGIAGATVFCGFTDLNDDYISKVPVIVGKNTVEIPATAKYVYLSFFGSTYIDSYTIIANSLVDTKELDEIGVNNPYKGKKGVAFGTSLTYRAQTTGGYLQYLPDMLGMTFDNQGVGSSYWYTSYQTSANVLYNVQQYSGYADKDLCIIEGCVNDWYNNKNLGSYSDTAATTVCGCLYNMISHIYSQNPNIQIVVILDHYGRNYNNVDCSSSAVNAGGKTQYEYYEEIAKCCEYLGIPVIKEYAISSIGIFGEQFLLDNIHCNDAGAKQSANVIGKAMKNMSPKI